MELAGTSSNTAFNYLVDDNPPYPALQANLQNLGMVQVGLK